MTFYLWDLLKVLVGVIMVVGYLSITGRSQSAQMTAVDMFGNFILGGVIGGVLYNDEVRFGRYVLLLLICIAVLILTNYLTRNLSFLRKASLGRPIPIIENGRFVIESFDRHRAKLDINDLATGLRMQGFFGFGGIQFAQLEPNGHISVIKGDEPHPTRFVVYRGELLKHELEAGEFEEDWVRNELRVAGVPDLKDIFLAEWCYERMVIVREDGEIIRGPQRPERSVNARNPLPTSRLGRITRTSFGAG